MTQQQRQRLKKEKRNQRKKNSKHSSSTLIDNIVNITENVKSPFHNESLKGFRGKIVDVNDYDEYFLGGIKSFHKDSFFKSVFSSLSECKNMEFNMRFKGWDYLTEGGNSGIVHVVKWNRDLSCFLVWKHVPKDSFDNQLMKMGGKMFSLNNGKGLDSIVNHKSNI